MTAPVRHDRADRAAHSALITARLLADARDVARRRVERVTLPLGLSADYVRGPRRRPTPARVARRRTYLRGCPSYPTRPGGPGLPVAV